MFGMAKPPRIRKKICWITLLIICIVALVVFGKTGVLSNNVMRYLMQIFLYIALGEAWNLLSGFAGLTSLGQQLYIGLTGYTIAVATTTYHLSPVTGILIGLLICAIASFLLSFLLFRMNGMYFAVASWVASEAVCLFFLSWDYVNQGGGMIMSITPYPTITQIYLASLVLCVATVIAVYLLVRSRTGLALMNIRDDSIAAESIGVDIKKCKLISYVISALMTSLVGGLFFINKGTIYPDSGFSIGWTISSVFIVIIGGSGTVGGPIFGAIIYVLLHEYLAHYSGWSNILLGIITILVILFLPDGMLGSLQKRLHFELFSQRRYSEPME